MKINSVPQPTGSGTSNGERLGESSSSKSVESRIRPQPRLRFVETHKMLAKQSSFTTLLVPATALLEPLIWTTILRWFPRRLLLRTRRRLVLK